MGKSKISVVSHNDSLYLERKNLESFPHVFRYFLHSCVKSKDIDAFDKGINLESFVAYQVIRKSHFSLT